MASLLPILRASLTVSARFTLPISRLFILDGFGSLSIHSGTDEPDCRMTFAILKNGVKTLLQGVLGTREYLHFKEWRVFISEICHRFSFAAHTAGTP